MHLQDGCKAGRTAQARLMRAEPDNWVTGTDRHHAYAGGGWGTALLVTIFMGAFLLLAGALPFVCTVLFPLQILMGLYDRVTARTRGRSAGGTSP
ncbi:hypothetical protein [Actinomadura rudentiformis]|uniref:Uncharacterized protein n=1 Tax=Actinomadura rudentiformis TaxID=359158 RepID=A0A6H9YC93_9ACTN|nr:hypothetical protein [Actinomadura rudentiformis]KAB2341621.1 hypothetical protein F8566_41565 [Actinomadura rudentiformis]